MSDGVVIVGSLGMLGRELAAACRTRGLTALEVPGPEGLDITDPDAVDATLERCGGSAVINAAALTDVDGLESDPAAADRVNHAGAANLARTCARLGVPLVYYSTDYIFDGAGRRPYRVDDPPAPLGVYGRSKLAGERAVCEIAGDHLVVRTSWLYAAHGRNFVRTILKAAGERDRLDVVDDQEGRPTYAADLARMTLDLLDRDARGIWHVANGGTCTWHGFARAIVTLAGLDCDVRPCRTADHPRPAPRPAYGVLDLTQTADAIGEPRPWREALVECLDEIREGALA